MAQLAERNEPLRAFVPKRQADAAQTLEQREPANGAELRVFVENLGEPIERYSAAQVVYMVNADIGREPTQDAGQVIVRAAADGSIVEGPGFRASPVGILELVLDIEQPD